MVRKSLLVLFLLPALGLSGCATIIYSKSPRDVNYTGIAYSLPKGYILLKAQRKVVTEQDEQKAKDAITTASKQVDIDKQLLAKAQEQELADPAKSEVTNRIKAQLKKNELTFEAAKRNADATKAGNCKESSSLDLLPLIADPDPNFRYIANLNHVVTRDDSMKMTVDSKGLLSSGEATSTDQSLRIIVESLELALGMPVGPIAAEVKKKKEVLPAPPSCVHYELSVPFDPTDLKSFKSAQDVLTEQSNGILTLKADLSPGSDRPSAPANRNDGLFYRPATSVKVEVVRNKDVACGSDIPCGSKYVLQTAGLFAVVPDSNSVYLVNYDASAFVTTTQKITFKDGMLTSYDVKRPSEPYAVIDYVASVPGKVSPIKVNADIHEDSKDYSPSKDKAGDSSTGQQKNSGWTTP